MIHAKIRGCMDRIDGCRRIMLHAVDAWVDELIVTFFDDLEKYC